jgi:hypothetical protein
LALVNPLFTFKELAVSCKDQQLASVLRQFQENSADKSLLDESNMEVGF